MRPSGFLGQQNGKNHHNRRYDVIPATTEPSSDDNNINCNTSTCIKDKILSAIDHIKSVRHELADTDLIFEFISKNSPDVDKCDVISTLSDLFAENTITNKICPNGLDSYKRIKQTFDSVTADDEQQLVVTTELPTSNLPSELPTPPQSHIDTPQIPNSRPVFKNSHKECIDQIDRKINSLNTFIDHELSVLHDKMDSLSEGLQDVLTNKQHMENKNMNTLQENINNLQKQLLEKDEIIRFLIETQAGLIEILKSPKIIEIQKVQNSSTNHPLTFPEQRHQHHSPSINLQDSPAKSGEYHTNSHHQQNGKQQQHHTNHTQIPQHSKDLFFKQLL